MRKRAAARHEARGPHKTGAGADQWEAGGAGGEREGRRPERSPSGERRKAGCPPSERGGAHGGGGPPRACPEWGAEHAVLLGHAVAMGDLVAMVVGACDGGMAETKRDSPLPVIPQPE